jgi:hypothetical protein
MGRLGNQMFQYAAGRALADRRGVELLLDTSWFDYARGKGIDTRYELDCFALDVRLAPVWDVARIRGRSGVRRLRQRLRPSRRPLLTSIDENSTFAFEPRVLVAEDNTYLSGYWQSQAYFADRESLIRDDFAFPALEADGAQLASEIAVSPSVSVHVRRADYVASERARALIGSLDATYYADAVDAVGAVAGELALFVFSDDPDWCRRNLVFACPTTIVDRALPADRAWEDLCLMSLCRHHIVANSSFSWWGAWLDESPDKIVVAPRHWLAAGEHPHDRRVPEAWLRV